MSKKIYIGILIVLIALIITSYNYISVKHIGYLNVDVSVWTNIAKGIEDGKIIYKDMFDHKGPLLYFFYFVSYFLGKQLGLWTLDLLLNIITVSMIYLISKTIVKDKWTIFIVIAFCVFFLVNICYENPCTESIAIPFTLIAFYQAIKFIFNKESFKNKESLITSICFTIVLLLRPNLLVFWVVFYFYVLIELLKEREIKRLLKIILFSVLGVAIILIPIVLYFIINNSWNEFINTYLIFNIKYIGEKEDTLKNILQIFVTKTNFIIPIIFVIYFYLLCIKKSIEEKDYTLLKICFVYYILAFAITIIPQRSYLHYMITMMPTFIVPLALYFKYIKLEKLKCFILVIICCLIFVKSFTIQKSKASFYNKTSNLKDTLNKNIDWQNNEGDLLVIGNSTNIYLLLDKQYNGKYFFQEPIFKQSDELCKDIIKDIEEHKSEYIIYITPELHEYNDFQKQIKKILIEDYTNIDQYIYKNRQ